MNPDENDHNLHLGDRKAEDDRRRRRERPRREVDRRREGHVRKSQPLGVQVLRPEHRLLHRLDCSRALRHGAGIQNERKHLAEKLVILNFKVYFLKHF